MAEVEILRITNDDDPAECEAKGFLVEAMKGMVTLTMSRPDWRETYFYMDEEETLMVAVALLEALKVANPVYGELEDMVNELMEVVEDESETSNEDA
jgi:hypothetical protein